MYDNVIFMFACLLILGSTISFFFFLNDPPTTEFYPLPLPAALPILFRSITRRGLIQPGRLSGIDVARIVKKLAARAGLEAANSAGHSLRAGHATSAAIAGASEIGRAHV